MPPSNGTNFRTPEIISAAIKSKSGLPRIMGILNVTPDSFHEASRIQHTEKAVSAAQTMWKDGATWVDIGGESTRPNAEPVSIEEEISRVIPVIEAIREVNQNDLISIDTRNYEVAKKAIEAGADMINDVSGLRDSRMYEYILKNKIPVCIMHMQNNPEDMQNSPSYEDVVEEVSLSLTDTASKLISSGFPKELICIDPGIGFGKTQEHNIKLLKAGKSILGTNDVSLLWGVSRKSLIGQLCNLEKTSDRLAGTLGSSALAFNYGIDIIRVHDVKENYELLKVMDSIHNSPID